MGFPMWPLQQLTHGPELRAGQNPNPDLVAQLTGREHFRPPSDIIHVVEMAVDTVSGRRSTGSTRRDLV
jgi:hypothetical protein